LTKELVNDIWNITQVQARYLYRWDWTKVTLGCANSPIYDM